MGLAFKWDAKKAAANLQKHGVSFEEATSAFGDPLSLTICDPQHSGDEERYVLVGLMERHRLVVVAHTEEADTVHIINARPATPTERRDYEEGQA